MHVYLVRHAIAVPRGTPGLVDDAGRELTPTGEKRMRRNAAALLKLGVVIDEVWTSPLLRARQTARILAEGLGLRNAPRMVKALEPGGDVEEVFQKLGMLVNRAGVALVGHEPDLGELATRMLLPAMHSVIEFRKGAVACIAVDDFNPPLQGRLQWMLTSRQMRMMA
jgi:phosphohistidine phosphatase